jgi:hypothetical protein
MRFAALAILLFCCTIGAVSSREGAAYTGLAAIPAASCFRSFLEPLRAFVNGASYGSGVFISSTTTSTNDELVTDHLATVGRASVPEDMVNGLLTDIQPNAMPEAILAAVYDNEHHVAVGYLATSDDNSVWMVATSTAPSNYVIHTLVYRYSSTRHLGIGSSRDSVEAAMGMPSHVATCDGYEALSYKTRGDSEGRYGYMFVLRKAKVVALRYTLGV